MAAARLERAVGVDRGRFLARHLAAEQPLLAADGAAGWAALRLWTWDRLAARFGDREVDLFGDWFEATGRGRFGDFVARLADPDPGRNYVRWSSRDRSGEGRWADAVFDELEGEWEQPAFLPERGYLVPFCDPSARADAASSPFPYRQLLLSATGARTRLHLDPWASAAVLCQVVGHKRIALYHPADGPRLLCEAKAGARETALTPAFQVELHPGEVLYVPAGWWHHAETLSPSVTITWNFVHVTAAGGLLEHARAHHDDPELAVVEYFLQRAGLEQAGAGIAELLEAALLEAIGEGAFDRSPPAAGLPSAG